MAQQLAPKPPIGDRPAVPAAAATAAPTPSSSSIPITPIDFKNFTLFDKNSDFARDDTNAAEIISRIEVLMPTI